MARSGKNHWLRYLGTLRGSGRLSLRNGNESLGAISYEIEGFGSQFARSANGQIEGDSTVLTQAFRAGRASILLSDGLSVAVVLTDPQGGSTAEVVVSGSFPL